MSDAGMLPAATMLAPSEALLRGFELAPETAAAQAAAELHLRQGFTVGSVNLMLGYEHGSELTELPTVHRLPHAPAWLLGMVNLHGALLPVFDLARLFNVAHAEGERRMLLVLGHGGDAAGVVIDGLPRRLRFDAGNLAEPDVVPAVLSALVDRAALIDGRVWFDLDVTALLSALENTLSAPQ